MADIIRRTPTRAMTVFEPLYRPFSLLDEVEAMARDMFDGTGYFFRAGEMSGLDVYREKDDLVVKAELPGVSKKDLTVSLEDDVLTIKAEKKQEEVTEDAECYISERRFGSYSRAIALPFEVDAEKISATFKNGLLEMRLPRAEETKAKHIDITVK